MDDLCLGAACTGCIPSSAIVWLLHLTLPRRCLHGVHPPIRYRLAFAFNFASALPARGASAKADKLRHTIL